jgi:hypothetical protein
MVRIRYTVSTGSGLLTSKPVLALDKLLVVNLDTVNNTFTVVNQTNGLVVANGKANDTVALKKNAKQALRQLGVVFQDEVRRRTSETENTATTNTTTLISTYEVV